MKNIAYSLAIVAFVSAFAVTKATHAQTLPQGGNPVKSIMAKVDIRGKVHDAIEQSDADLYKRLDLDKRYGVKFRAHKEVCSEGADDSIHCNARVVTDDAGTPVTVEADAADLTAAADQTTDYADTSRRDRRIAPNAISKTPTGLSPAKMLSAYGLSGKASGATPQIIAIVDAYDHPNIASDLSVYSSKFNIPNLPTCTKAIASSTKPCFQKVNQLGQTKNYPASNPSWALEIALDVEAAHAICQNCSILLVEANGATYEDLTAAIDRAVMLGAKYVSNSWGSIEFPGQSAFDYHFQKPGVVFTFSAGDSGYGVQYPASSPYVTAVGGTTLLLNSDGSYNQEIAWSGTGSGCSAFSLKPAFQIDSLCINRTVADVSAVADPNTGMAVYTSVPFNGQKGWMQIGGTSLAAPIIAATYALAHDVPSNTMGNALPYTRPATAFHDVVSGTNGFCEGSYLCQALAGFDGPTGLGTPKGILGF